MNKKNIWKTLYKNKKIEPQCYAKGVPNNQEIIELEKALNVNISEQYKKFLIEFGGAELDAYVVFGLYGTSFMGPDLNTVISNTQFYRNQNFPGTDKWYVVSDDGSGNPFGVDAEGKVWLSDHDSHEFILVADDFEEFLHILFHDLLWSEDYRQVISWPDDVFDKI